MRAKSSSRTRHSKVNLTPGERDFAALDNWARNLKLSDGRALTAAERREEKLARSVGRPRKPESAKAKRLMISMTPELIEAAGIYAKRTGRTLSGLIAESLEEKLRRRAS
ncbi:MAG TPA: hypothetical protein VK797_25940 [Tepidisphaeraceae bacterium]|nr:hypothetical protein [Tepidisphaeraceae bacterium]